MGSFVGSLVRSLVSNLNGFTEKKVGGNQMPPSSEVLKHRVWNFLSKKGRSVAIKAKWKIF